MKLKAQIKFADEKAKHEFSMLEESVAEKDLYSNVVKSFERLQENAFCGIQIQKNRIPKEYLSYGIDNCWKLNLPNGWRLLYAIQRDELVILAIIFEWMGHKEYERRFGYR
jgi:hypothetical protein